jgi:hypothetical protein
MTPAAVASEPPSPTPVPQATGYAVSIAPGIEPKWTAGDAANVAMSRLLVQHDGIEQLAEPQVLSVSALKGKDAPEEFSGPFPEYDVVWIVDCQGTFVQQSGWIGKPLTGSRGYFVYDDTGSGIAFGATFLLTTPRPTD